MFTWKKVGTPTQPGEQVNANFAIPYISGSQLYIYKEMYEKFDRPRFGMV